MNPRRPYRLSDGKVYKGYRIYSDGCIDIPATAINARDCALGVIHLDKGTTYKIWEEAVENDLNIPGLFEKYRLMGNTLTRL